MESSVEGSAGSIESLTSGQGTPSATPTVSERYVTGRVRELPYPCKPRAALPHPRFLSGALPGGSGNSRIRTIPAAALPYPRFLSGALPGGSGNQRIRTSLRAALKEESPICRPVRPSYGGLHLEIVLALLWGDGVRQLRGPQPLQSPYFAIFLNSS